MIQKGKAVSKILLIISIVSLIITSVTTSAFAASDAKYTIDSNGKLTSVQPDIKVFGYSDSISLIIPSNVKSIGSNVISYRENMVDSITIPSSVKSIDSDAFSNCSNLKTVTIDNYNGAVSIASGAFPSSASIYYTQEKPTAATTAAPTTKASVTTTKAPVTTTKPTTTKKVTTTVPSETTTEELTTNEDLAVIIMENETVEITDATPFAEAKEQLSDMNVWEQLTNQTTLPAEQPERKLNPVTATASYAAVVLVAFSAVTLGYFKFKK